jgi:hypothetical protein
MSWFRGMGGDPPPSPQPLRSLTLPRLMNTLLNPFATSGNTTADNQKDIYIYGDGSDIPFAAGTPMWVYVSFDPLGALKTGRSRILMPNNFTLLSYFASATVLTALGGFKVNVYDATKCRRQNLTERPLNFNLLAGTGSSPLFQGSTKRFSSGARPYSFAPDNAQVLVTIVNMEAVNNFIQFGMYGVQGGQPQ